MPTSDPKASLLLVDDTPANLLALEAVLEPLGQRLVTASSGDEALKHLLREEFAAVLLDVQMPGIDGFKTAELIRTREQTRYVPILFLTAVHREEAHILRGYTAGAVEYLVKPYNPDMLRAKVKVFVDLYLTSARLRQREALLRERERAEEEAHRTDLYSKLRAGEEQFRRIMESNLMGMLFTDFEGRALDANDAFLRTVGYSQDELLRGDVDERRLTPPEWAQAAEFAARELAERGVARPYEKEYVRRDGRRTPVVVASTRVESQARDIAFVLDITARKEAEARLRFLVDATATLSSSIDYETTLKTVAGLAVPTLADFCFVDLLEETGRVRRVAVANADPTQAAIAEQSRLYPPDLERNARHPAALALARSETVLMEGLGSEERVAMAQDPDHAELMQQAGIHSMVAVPLVARGRTLGVMTFLL
ncbi:MAG TPA: response regulator, partial [Myxococcaceae bacterium]|nr:response regulator [Myxococcaceae bacterium]